MKVPVASHELDESVPIPAAVSVAVAAAGGGNSNWEARLHRQQVRRLQDRLPRGSSSLCRHRAVYPPPPPASGCQKDTLAPDQSSDTARRSRNDALRWQGRHRPSATVEVRISDPVGTFVDVRLSPLWLQCHRVPRSKLPRAVPRVPIPPLLVSSLEGIKPNHRLCFSNLTVCPRLPSSEQLFLVKCLPFFAPCVTDISSPIQLRRSRGKQGQARP